MDIEQFRLYCLSKKAATEDFPFDEHTLCLRVMGKIFCILPLERSPFVANLKCDPDYALELRERYPEISPGYHMSKTNWNTIELEGGLSGDLIRSLVDLSYDLVVKGLKKKEREALMADNC